MMEPWRNATALFVGLRPQIVTSNLGNETTEENGLQRRNNNTHFLRVVRAVAKSEIVQSQLI